MTLDEYVALENTTLEQEHEINESLANHLAAARGVHPGGATPEETPGVATDWFHCGACLEWHGAGQCRGAHLIPGPSSGVHTPAPTGTLADVHTQKKAMTVVLRPSPGAAKADADLVRLESGARLIVEVEDENYFFRLRRRLVENPELAKEVEVVWLDNERFQPIDPLDDKTWPRNFANDAWHDEIAVKVARDKGRTPAHHVDGDPR